MGAGTCAQPLVLCALPWLVVATWRLGWSLIAPDALLAAALHVVSFIVLWLMTSCRDPGIIPRGFDRSAWESEFPELLLSPAEAAQRSAGVVGGGECGALNPALFGGATGSAVVAGSARASGSSGVPWAWRECAICECARPPGAMHCRACDHCVVGLDHHCSVFGVCIGARNIHTFRFAIVFGYGSLFVLASTVPLIALDLIAEFAPLISSASSGAARAARPWLVAAAHCGALVHFSLWIAVTGAFLRVQYFPHAIASCAPWTRRARVLRAERAGASPAAGERAGATVDLGASASGAGARREQEREPCAALGWLHGGNATRHWAPREPLCFAARAPTGGSRRTCAPGVKIGNRFTRPAAAAAARGGAGVWDRAWATWPSQVVSLIRPHARIPIAALSSRVETGAERAERLDTGARAARLGAASGARRAAAEARAAAGEEISAMLMTDECGCCPPAARDVARLRAAHAAHAARAAPRSQGIESESSAAGRWAASASVAPADVPLRAPAAVPPVAEARSAPLDVVGAAPAAVVHAAESSDGEGGVEFEEVE